MNKHVNLLDLSKDYECQILRDANDNKSSLVSFRISELEKEKIQLHFNKNFGITNFSECLRVIIHSYIKNINE